MSQNQLSVSTFIPESIGSKDILFENAPLIGTVEFIDGVIVFFPAFVFIFIGDIILPSFLEPYTMIIAVMIALIGSMTLIVKPNYMTLHDWLTTWWDFRGREKELEKNMKGTDGKPFDSYSAVPDEDTRSLTKVDKVYPERNAIQLENGNIIKILEFSGSNLDMASPELVISTVDQYARSLSSGLDSDIQFYLPMRPVSVEATRNVYEKQIEESEFDLADKNEGFMDAYLEDRVSWVDSLGANSFVREQYVIIKVTEAEVYNQSVGGGGGLEQLPGGEVVADISRLFTGEAAVQSKQEVIRKQLREIENEAENVGSMLSVGPGNSYSVVQTPKAVSLIKEFWEGEKVLEDEMSAMQTEYPFPVFSEKTDGDKQ